MSVAPSLQPSDRAVADAMLYLCETGDIHELRIPGTKLHRTVAGLFRIPDHLNDFARAVEQYNDENSIYFTINPVKPDPSKRLGVAFPRQVRTVRDEEILRRRWLPIDFDAKPAHDAKRSATEEEVEACVSRAQTVGKYLADTVGIARQSMVLARSGNGAHLLLRLDLPNDAESRDLLQDVLLGLAITFDDEKVEIDAKCYNAARIWKVYGSYARKGENTPLTPHRRAMLNEKIPPLVKPLDPQLLYRVAVLAPRGRDEDKKADYDGPQGTFDIDSFIAKHFPRARSGEPYSGGRRWILNQCPFNDDHKGSSVAILQLSRGGLSFCCQHNSCRDNRWEQVRALLEPKGRKEKRAAEQHTAHQASAPTIARDDALALSPPDRHLALVPPPGEDEMERKAALVSTQFSDVGNARLLVERYGHDYLYCGLWKKWLHWSGARWEIDDKCTVFECAREIALSYIVDASRTGLDTGSAMYKWGQRSHEHSKIKAMVAEAETMLAILPHEFDSDVWLLNCANGTINLRTGAFYTPRREDKLTKMAPYPYDPEAECPLWEEVLSTWMDGDMQMVLYAQRLAGYILTGDTREQCFHILIGTGSNGKTVFTETLYDLMGDYAATTGWSTFASRKADANGYELATLDGARLVLTSEIPENGRISESLVKQLTGGDTVQVRRIYGEPFAMTPRFKILMSTNHMPKIGNTDNGIWRRPKKVDFKVKIDKPDMTLKSKLLDVAPGILRWAVEGCAMWQKMGLQHPAKVEAATEEYRADSDVLGHWLKESCILREGLRTPMSMLYPSYKDWCKDAGFENPSPKNTLGKKLKERGIEEKHTNKGSVYLGIGLRTADDAEPEYEQAALGGAQGF